LKIFIIPPKIVIEGQRTNINENSFCFVWTNTRHIAFTLSQRLSIAVGVRTYIATAEADNTFQLL